MEKSPINPAPPDLAGLSWWVIGLEDLAALTELAGICHLSDGGLGFLFVPEELQSRYFPEPPRAAIGAFSANGHLVACASVYINGDPGAQRARMVGMVRPDARNQGIGTYLLHWSQEQAKTLLAEIAEPQRVIQIATESLTEPANRLYLAHGFTCVFEELVMERDLHLPLPDRPLPEDTILMSWQPELAEQFFQAYHAAFRERPGFPGWSDAEWIAHVTENDHIPDWSLLARVGDMPVGFVIGNTDLTTDPTGGFVWQVGVVPSQRRRGLASALLTETMRRMQAAGATRAQLTVHLNNPGAIQAYNELGFETVGRRARYEQILSESPNQVDAREIK